MIKGREQEEQIGSACERKKTRRMGQEEAQTSEQSWESQLDQQGIAEPELPDEDSTDLALVPLWTPGEG